MVTASISENADTGCAELATAIERAAHLLPAQGPIDVFVHHNTLHAFEDQNFDDAVADGLKTFDASPYWPEDSQNSPNASNTTARTLGSFIHCK